MDMETRIYEAKGRGGRVSFHAPKQYMKPHPLMGMGEGNNGFFMLRRKGVSMAIVASDGGGWEHVSVSTEHRCPTWDEMCFVKDLFWDDEDCVIQYHPPKSEYVNNCGHCLHMWRPIGQDIPRPDSMLVGIK